MKILMFGWEYPPHNSGGLGVACEGLVNALADKNEQVIFVLPKKIPIKTQKKNIKFLFADIKNIKNKNIISGSYPLSFMTCEDGSKIPFYGASILQDVLEFRKVVKNIIKDVEFDVIHAHDWLSFGAGITAKKLSGKPLVSHVHATEYDRTGGNSKNESVFILEKEGLENADKIVTVSNYTKNIVVREYNIPEKKIEVIHNGVHPPKDVCNAKLELSNLKAKGKKIVIWFGRITLQKGVDYLISSAEKVLKQDKNVIFIIAGSGDMKSSLMNYVSYKNLSDKIIFTDFLRGPELQCLIDAADLYVMTSVSEPFGLVPLEVLQKGVPVIIPKQSGVSEVLTHALKVDFWDTDEIANKILASLSYGPLHKTLKEGGQKESMAQTWEKAAEKCISLYNKLIPKFA